MDIDADSTAVIVMHAWDYGTYEKYPGWYRAAEYIPRAKDICRTTIPKVLEAARSNGIKVLHVASSESYCMNYPGYKRAVSLSAEKDDNVKCPGGDLLIEELHRFKIENGFVGAHNLHDVEKAFENMGFSEFTRPVEDEGVAATSDQLAALCCQDGIRHLIYTGVAINWCLMDSPGGMVDMQRRGFLCSAIRQAVTAVENKETARNELCKDIALWKVSVGFGFVYDIEDFVSALRQYKS